MLVALLAVPWAGWAVVRTLGLDGGHPLVSMMAFTPYVAASAIVPLVVAVLAREWVVVTIAAAALAALLTAVVPRVLPGPQLAERAPAPQRRLVVMSANLHFGAADAGSIMRLVRRYDVDVLALLELSLDAVARLDAAGARAWLPGRILAPQQDARGIGLMARRPLVAISVLDPTAGHVEASLRLASGRRLRVAAVHPIPPISGGRVLKWRTTLRELPSPSDGGVPNILLGDFNGTLDNRELRRVLERGYTDAADATGAGLRPTFPVGRAIPPITIDHVLVPPTIEVHALSVHEIRDSDHRALVAELVLPPS